MRRRSRYMERLIGGYMQLLRILSFVVNVYSMVIIFRIILTWFPGNQNSTIYDVLSRITDPYLDWFRRFNFLRVGFLDLSPVAALACLSLLNRVLMTLAFYGTISIGIILSIIVQAVWGILSIILGFLFIVLLIQLVAYFLNLGTEGPLMRIINAISQPVLYNISRFIFKDRLVNFTSKLVISVVGIGLCYIILRYLLSIFSGMMARLPI